MHAWVDHTRIIMLAHVAQAFQCVMRNFARFVVEKLGPHADNWVGAPSLANVCTCVAEPSRPTCCSASSQRCCNQKRQKHCTEETSHCFAKYVSVGCSYYIARVVICLGVTMRNIYLYTKTQGT